MAHQTGPTLGLLDKEIKMDHTTYIRVKRGSTPVHAEMVTLDGVPFGETNAKGEVLIPADGKQHTVSAGNVRRVATFKKGHILEIDIAPPPPAPQASSPRAMPKFKLPPMKPVGLFGIGIIAVLILVLSWGSIFPKTVNVSAGPAAAPEAAPVADIPAAAPSWEAAPTIPQLTPLDVANNPWIGMIQVLYAIAFGGTMLAGYLNAKERQQVGDFIAAAVALTAVFIMFSWQPVAAFTAALFNLSPGEGGSKAIALAVLSGSFFAVLTASFVGGRDFTSLGMFLGGLAIGGAVSGGFGILDELFQTTGNNAVVPASQWWALIRTKNFETASFTTTILVLYVMSLASYGADLVKPDKKKQPAWGAVIVAFISPIVYVIARMALPQTPPWLILIAVLGMVAIVASLFRQFGFGTANFGNPNRVGVGSFVSRPSWDVVGLFLVWGAFLITLSGWV
jgi:hypothetical protein